MGKDVYVTPKKRRRIATMAPCSNCGYRVEVKQPVVRRDPRSEYSNTYLVVMACATCGVPFSLISRN